MYALIASSEENPEPTLLATAETFEEIQTHYDDVRPDTRYDFIGILSDRGLLNFYGDPVKASSTSRVVCRMFKEYKEEK